MPRGSHHFIRVGRGIAPAAGNAKQTTKHGRVLRLDAPVLAATPLGGVFSIELHNSIEKLYQKDCWVPRIKARVFSLLGLPKTSSGVPISSMTPSAM